MAAQSEWRAAPRWHDVALGLAVAGASVAAVGLWVLSVLWVVQAATGDRNRMVQAVAAIIVAAVATWAASALSTRRDDARP